MEGIKHSKSERHVMETVTIEPLKAIRKETKTRSLLQIEVHERRSN